MVQDIFVTDLGPVIKLKLASRAVSKIARAP